MRAAEREYRGGHAGSALRMLRLLLVLLLPFAAIAGEREEAEKERLVEEIKRFSEQQLWQGVERRYEEILALEGVEVPRDVHLKAAYAARAVGDMAATLSRLERAAAIQHTDEVDEWIRAINEEYGRVQLSTEPPRSVELKCDAMPFATDQRKAVEFATEQLSNEGSFVGMLPAGRYTLAGKEFEVIPGTGTLVELSTKELRAAKKREKKGGE